MPKVPRKKQPKGEYKVGYAKPPAQHQFRKGQPRPPRKEKSEASEMSFQDYLAEELKEPMRIVENGVEMIVPKGKAMAKAAIKGVLDSKDPRRLKGFLPPPRLQEDIDFSEIDLAIVARFFAQWLPSPSPQPDGGGEGDAPESNGSGEGEQ